MRCEEAYFLQDGHLKESTGDRRLRRHQIYPEELGQIHFTIGTNTYCNLDKYIWGGCGNSAGDRLEVRDVRSSRQRNLSRFAAAPLFHFLGRHKCASRSQLGHNYVHSWLRSINWPHLGLGERISRWCWRYVSNSESQKWEVSAWSDYMVQLIVRLHEHMGKLRHRLPSFATNMPRLTNFTHDPKLSWTNLKLPGTSKNNQEQDSVKVKTAKLYQCGLQFDTAPFFYEYFRWINNQVFF